MLTVKLAVVAWLLSTALPIAAVQLAEQLWTELPVTVPCLVAAAATLAIVMTADWHTSVQAGALAVKVRDWGPPAEGLVVQTWAL